MNKKLLALSAIAFALAGCASPEQTGVANGGDAANVGKIQAAAEKQEAATLRQCQSAEWLFVNPQTCVSRCHVTGSPAWTQMLDVGDVGLFGSTTDRFVTTNFPADPLHLIGDQDACLQSCRVNQSSVAYCQNKGAWHPDVAIRPTRQLPYYSSPGRMYRVPIQPYFDPAYKNQQIIVAMSSVSGSGPSDEIVVQEQVLISRLTNKPVILASLNALGQALGMHEEVGLNVPISNARSFQVAPIKTLNKNPPGVQWPTPFDGNIVVDQSVN